MVVARCGRLDILINNAARPGAGVSATEVEDQDWDEVIETNLASTVLLSRDAAQHMTTGGVIINLTAIQENLPLAGRVSYIASKGGVSAAMRALAVDLAPHGIRVNAVRPGVIETPSLADSRREAAGAAGSQDSEPATLLRRSGRPEDVAEAACFLASERAPFITGSILTLDGGRSISRRPDPLAPDEPDADADRDDHG